MKDLLQELWQYAKERKKFLIIPIILLLLMLGAILLFSQGSVLAPFIYTLF